MRTTTQLITQTGETIRWPCLTMENRLITAQDFRACSPGTSSNGSAGGAQRTTWAAQCDWERHRDRIIDLYKFQDHTLRSVMHIMQHEQGFVATPKMYKYHLRKWGIQKNLRAKQARELLQQTRHAGREVTEVSIGGIRVDQDRLRNLLKRASKAQRGAAGPPTTTTTVVIPPTTTTALSGSSEASSSPATCRLSPPSPPSPSPLPTARLRPPHPQPQLEQVLHALRSYVSGSFGAGRWTRSHVPWQDELVVAAHNCSWSAGRLMNAGHVRAAFRLLSICMDSCRHLLMTDTPYFPASIYALLFEFSKRHGDLSRAVLGFLRDLSLVVYGSRRHPVYVLFEAMRQMSSAQMTQCAWAVSRAYQDALLAELGEGSAYEAQLAAHNGRNLSWTAAYGAVDDLGVEMALQENLEDVSSGAGAGASVDGASPTASFEALEARLRIANFMLDRDRYAEARDLAEEVLAQAQAGEHGPGAQDAYLLDDCYRILFWVSRREGTAEETTAAAARWVGMCTARLGRWHELTVDALGEVAGYHRDAGNADEAERLRLDHEDAIEGMCERLERLGLGYEGATPQRRTVLYGRTTQQPDAVIKRPMLCEVPGGSK
ncbi:hypothetical protein KVR01_008582 [Diaporthe batatas]|uniref:uncharacterized protein n=1 Tax=Diaporthe batatas TaxID=748121 RepID=UPI001D05B1DB|nr:uncharacterized protein KVR01_008582 [Diaporthe batatas]KAG8161595.1 hypothetical protein KVR01_008582 [Diaporthe batatas]